MISISETLPINAATVADVEHEPWGLWKGIEMGRFANESDGQGARIFPATEINGDDGFAALGKPVPMYRRAAAYEHMKAMGCTDKDAMWSCIEAMSDRIARDEPHAAMELALQHVDATGVYRLLAVLLTAPEAG